MASFGVGDIVELTHIYKNHRFLAQPGVLCVVSSTIYADRVTLYLYEPDRKYNRYLGRYHTKWLRLVQKNNLKPLDKKFVYGRTH